MLSPLLVWSDCDHPAFFFFFFVFVSLCTVRTGLDAVGY